MEVYAKGKRGIIYKKGNVCIKVKNPRSTIDTLRNEAKFLQILNKKRIGPKFIKYENKKLYRAFIDGIKIKNFLEKEKDKKKIIKVLKQVLEQCRTMDLMGINKKELTNPYKDILVTKQNKAVMIDFERCRESKKPKNVTQFLQYIARNKEVLAQKGIEIDKKKLIKLGKEYKEKRDKQSFDKIIRFISR
ncbi:hypothetical protein AYK26_05085 [Euryarchaeota archaeon SM23-78]|nr:MAG: hypothetical protein AYK26_05085 [Euryarchaeota archaeon SM23-78]MBW3001464.1 hypothetical protein [Candidatus Woesearchaeota archaeon]